MKKIITCLLCMSLLFGLTACNGKKERMPDVIATEDVSDLSDISKSS